MGTTGQSITLANSIIGVGILAMPFCFQQCGVLLATLILLLMGLVSRLCCYFLLKSALIARRRNFEFLAFHVFGSAGKLAVEMGIIGFLMGTCIAYFVVVGDLGPQIVAKMFNINQSDILRTSIMVIVSLVCVLPLGLLRNVDSLSNVSAATIGFYFCLVMKVIAEAASQLLAGDWYSRMEMWKPAGVLQCVPIFSMALFCQTQLFEIFESLPTLSLEKMNVVTKNAINICAAVYFTLGVFGYIAFSSHNISGNILMSLSPTMASDVIKLGFVMSVAFSFPLIIFPCRASLYSLLYRKVHPTHHDHIINHSIPESTFRCITVCIIAVALFISLLIPNIELVLGLVGSTIGVLICVVFPAACFVNVTFKNTNERVLAKGTVVLGLVIMVLGTYANMQAVEYKIDRYDDKITQERIDKIVEDFFEKMEKNGEVHQETIIRNVPSLEVVKVAVPVIKDSEIQPPNPVPPESQSNEKNPVQKSLSENKVKEVKESLPVVENVVDKLSETHPRDVQTKLNEAKMSNGIKKEIIVEEKSKEEVKPPTIQDKVQDKLDMMKQQQLIETIKQHGEEQKELIKEQKEILDEIIKTKKELQQNKIEDQNNEAKKIAVENIQKIASKVVQSLSGVTEKPIKSEIVDKKSEPLDKVANDAVQEIAKKAVEAIEAIREIKEQPNAQSPIINKIEEKPNNGVVNLVTEQKAIPNNQDQSPLTNIDSVNSVNVPLPNNNIPIGQSLVQEESKTKVNPLSNVKNPEINVLPVIGQNKDNNIVPPEPSNLPVNPPVQNINVDNQGNQKEVQKSHSHSPDEPQSYKQGEDTQKKINDNVNIIPNVPVPLALNGNSQIKNNQQNVDNIEIVKPVVEGVNNRVESSLVNNIQTNGAKDMVVNNNAEINAENSVPVRQKREVVDCTEKSSLKPEDKGICESLVLRTDTKPEEILSSKVDLNNVLPNSLPLDTMFHHVRSLKSYDDTEHKR